MIKWAISVFKDESVDDVAASFRAAGFEIESINGRLILGHGPEGFKPVDVPGLFSFMKIIRGL